MTIDSSANQIIQAALDICRLHTGTACELTFIEYVLPEDWGRNRVWRYRVEKTPAGFPVNLIVKVSKIGGGHIFNEWASLQFLNQFESLDALVPNFYGGDDRLELLVLEDLGAVRDQRDLEGENPRLAREALLACAREMALLLITTAGHEEEFNGIRTRFPAYERPLSMDQFKENFSWFFRTLPQLGLTASPGLEEEANAIILRLQDPNAPRAYTRGDVCPSNIAYHDLQTRFYDFEMGAFRSLFLSAAYFRISHLSCANGSLIPLELQAEAEEAYFQALAPLIPNPNVFQIDYAAAATSMLVWMLSIYLEKRDRPRHLATLRQRIFAALMLYTNKANFTAHFPHTAGALTRLHHKLDLEWTEEEKVILPFPAFQ